jgi:hypothetical protein
VSRLDEYADRYPPELVGSANNDRLLSMGYSATDLFATCAVQEAFGLTVLEARACIPDMVRNGVNALTVPATDVGAFCRRDHRVTQQQSPSR